MDIYETLVQSISNEDDRLERIDHLHFIGAALRRWFVINDPTATGLFPYRIPENYYIFDVETTGLSPEKDLVIEMSWAIVINKHLMNCTSILFDWTTDDRIDQAWLRKRMTDTARRMGERGREYKFTYEGLRADGINSRDALDQMFSTLVDSGREYAFGAAHNGYVFDYNMINANLERYSRHRLAWPNASIVDTGLLEKASQMNRPPRADESRDDWLQAVYNARVRVKWNLDEHCATKYMFDERYNRGTEDAHTSGADCRLVYILFETYRQLAEEADDHARGLFDWG